MSAPGREVMPCSAAPGDQPRMGEQQHRQPQPGEAATMARQPRRVVGVLGAVDGRDEVLAGVEPLRQGASGSASDGVAHPEADVDHHVADQDRARRPGPRRRGGRMATSRRGQQQVGGVVGEHPVVLLRHPPVERAQPGLQVGHAAGAASPPTARRPASSSCRRRPAPSPAGARRARRRARRASPRSARRARRTRRRGARRGAGMPRSAKNTSDRSGRSAARCGR